MSNIYVTKTGGIAHACSPPQPNENRALSYAAQRQLPWQQALRLLDILDIMYCGYNSVDNSIWRQNTSYKYRLIRFYDMKCDVGIKSL